MRIDMAKIGKSKVLAGALAGRGALTRLLNHLAIDPAEPEAVYLDFQDVEVATASYLRECVAASRDAIRARESFFYTVIANPNREVRDEFLELARARGDVFMTCILTPDNAVSKPEILGELEEKQLLTFALVQQHGPTDAGELMRKHKKDDGVRHATAWNNRLSALARMGVIVEMRQGRLKRYRPLFQET